MHWLTKTSTENSSAGCSLFAWGRWVNHVSHFDNKVWRPLCHGNNFDMSLNLNKQLYYVTLISVSVSEVHGMDKY